MNQHDPEYWRKLYEPYEPRWHSKTYLKRKYKPRKHSKLYYQNKYIYGGRTPREQREQERENRRRFRESGGNFGYFLRNADRILGKIVYYGAWILCFYSWFRYFAG